jgi:uncharacterized membrane protein YeaQ/YmgE (transglycosylase-associated protein family)
VLALLLSLFVIGVIAGFLARLIVPGRDPIGFWGTVLLGIVGSFVGGLLGSLLFEHTLALRGSGLFGSVVGAVIALLIYRASVRRGVRA